MQISAILMCVSCHLVAAGISPLSRCNKLDMTYVLDDNVTVYPLDVYKKTGYRHTTMVSSHRKKQAIAAVIKSVIGGDPFYFKAGKFSMIEHIGTHVDAPQHILATDVDKHDFDTIDTVHLDDLVGEACVVDIPKDQQSNKDYVLTINDLQDWERLHGVFHDKCIVIVRTPNEQWFYDPMRYLGIDGEPHPNEKGWIDNMHFPGMAVEAAEWLLKNRNLLAFGTNVMSLDAGALINFGKSVHTVILGANKPGIENMANTLKLPNRGATVIIMPLALKAGSGAPARIFAIGWDGPDDPCRISSSAAVHNLGGVLMLMIMAVNVMPMI